MFPALKKALFATLLCATFLCSNQLLTKMAFAQDVSNFTSIRYAVLRSSRGEKSDPIENELNRLGYHGQLIARARTGVLTILSAENGCTDWYLKYEPSAEQIFRSLHFVVDLSGNSEIVEREGSFGNLEYLQPYVAHTRQQQGSGSEIILNASGAFFRENASVHHSGASPNPFTTQAARLLVVGDFPGDTEQTRILTLLHELAHVIGLLPPDSGSSSAAFLSVQNTKTVLKNCKSQIVWAAKHPESEAQQFLSVTPVSAQPQTSPAFSTLIRVRREFPLRQ